MAAVGVPKNIAHTLLARAHSPEAAVSIFTEKVLHKPLHLRPTSPNPSSRNARSQRRLQRLRKKELVRRRQKPKPLSAKEKRILGVYDISKEARRYEIYVPLHALWVGYMQEILGLGVSVSGYVTAHSEGSKLASADYHGAEVLVVRSRCAGRVGLTGIVIRDTKYTFDVITKTNELKIIPKGHTVFQFRIPQPCASPGDGEPSGASTRDLIFELHGSQVESRPADRATKKFKPKNLGGL